MKAKVKTEFPGCPDGQPLPRQIKKGEVIEGDLADVAVREKWATRIREKPAPKSESGE